MCNLDYKTQFNFQQSEYLITFSEDTLISQSNHNNIASIANDIFEINDFFFSISSLNSIIIKIINSIKHNTCDQLFTPDFDYQQFYYNILNSLLSFEGDLVLFTSKLLLTLSYVSNDIVFYLSTKISEILSVFKSFYQNRYILILLQTIFVNFPSSVSDALDMAILDVFLNILESPLSQKKDIKIIASIIQSLTLNIGSMSQEQFDLCFDFAQRFIKICDDEIFDAALHIISHLQQKIDFSPDDIFQDESIHILIEQLSQHKNIFPIFQVLSHFHDVPFIDTLFDTDFPMIIEDIVRNEKGLICIQIIQYLIDQIINNNELVNHFSYMVLVFADSFDDFPLNLKINFLRFFFICLNLNFDFLFQQEIFEFIFCSVFDLLECVSEDDLNEILPMLNHSVSNKQEISDLIASNEDCYQAIYNLCDHDNEKISLNAQNIISII